MIFSSVVFIFLFLPITVYIYFLLAKQYRNYFLLFASLTFYAYGEKLFVFFMLASILVNYFTGLLIERSADAKKRKRVLIAAIAVNLLFLGYYKYTNFFIDSLNIVFSYLKITPLEHELIHLPIGISFFTFQAISYVVDVYRGKNKAQKNPVNIALYIAFFPQLIAGPIIRYKDVADQLIERVTTRKDFFIGLERFGAGVIKKIIIADVVAVSVNKIYLIPKDEMTTSLSWIAALGFFLQDYFDFSGYSDMAIGLGRMFGFKFLENFNYPYISRSITEFWNRWHMSLQTWIRDYLFNPLGGIRKGKQRVAVNLLTVFFLAGLWHGASWNFVFFGLFQGVLLISEQMFFKKILRRSWRPLQHIYVLLMLFITLVMFRNENLAYMLNTLKVMAGFGSSVSLSLWTYIDYKVIAAGVFGLIFGMPVVPYFKKMILQAKESGQRNRHFLFTMTYYTIYFVLIILCFRELTVAGKNPFIYFRF